MGGYGGGVSDRGVRFYYDWVREHYGPWEYPRHVPAAKLADVPDEPVPTREFEVRDGLPFLGGEPVHLWGIRCGNALLNPAVAERLCNNLDNMAAHGINLIGLSMQGMNGGFPDKDAGPNAYASSGKLIGGHAHWLERIVRAADRRGMVVCLTLMMPRKDQLLRDEAAVRRAIEETGRFLTERRLGNVFVNLYQEYDHPLRVDHDVFAEPGGAAKKARLTSWWKAAAPAIEAGICPNHQSSSPAAYPGAEVIFFQERMPIPDGGFAVNAETAGRDLAGNEGVFNRFAVESMRSEWSRYLDTSRTAFLFQSAFVESVRGKLGTGPNFAVGGGGTSTSDRGVHPFYEWMLTNVGRWEYPRHLRE
jgi:hypothetical protein